MRHYSDTQTGDKTLAHYFEAYQYVFLVNLTILFYLQIYKRNLEDNLKLRKAQTEIEKCEKELVEINEKLSGINTESIAEKESLISEQTKLFREKAQTEGQLGELKVIKSYKKCSYIINQNLLIIIC